MIKQNERGFSSRPATSLGLPLLDAMKRLASMLMVIALTSGLSFPVPALAVEAAGLETGHPALTLAGGREWHVAADGSDGAAGTLEAPFATIGHAIEAMQGGDTVYVHGGTYREEITSVPSGAAGKPSTICAYGDGEVWLSGGELVTGWKQEGDGNVWVADMDWDMRGISEQSVLGGDDGTAGRTFYDNLVFVNGEMKPEGRWPNATADQLLDRSSYARAEQGTGQEAVVDSAMPSDVDFTGGEVWLASGGGFLSQTATITGHKPAAHKLAMKSKSPQGFSYNPRAGNYYFITKSLATLDAPGEWYKDRDAGKLYLYEPAGVDPEELTVEAAARTHVVKLADASYVTFSGINARLGGIAFTGESRHCTFERGIVDCPDHKWDYYVRGSATGVLLGGTENLLARCEVKHAYGSAVQLSGSRNRVVNNLIHDVGYEHGVTDAAVRIAGREQLVSHNTIRHVMRGAVGGTFEASVISYNDMSDCMRVSQDGGVMYFNWHDYENSEIHHNLVHDTLDFPDDQIQVGLYLDSFTSSLVIYRNVVYGIQNSEEKGSRNARHLAYQLDPNSLNNVIVNNTFVNYRPTHLNFYPNQDCGGTVILNNIFQTLSFIDGPRYYPWNWIYQRGVKVERNILEEMGILFADNMEGEYVGQTSRPYSLIDPWKDAANHDYTLNPDLPAAESAIDKGRVIRGVTDGYRGAAPDLGAYEYGQVPWTAGCNRDADIEDVYGLQTDIPYRNLIENCGFEKVWTGKGYEVGRTQDGVFDDWDKTGTTQRLTMSSWSFWGNIVKQGGNCLVLRTSADSVIQHVRDLKPNTAYRIGGHALVSGLLVGPRELAGARAADGEAVEASKVAEMRKQAPVKLKGLSLVEFDGVGFGAGRDQVVVALSGVAVGQRFTIALDDPSNVVAVHEVTEGLTAAEQGWRWIPLKLDKAYGGAHSVFVSMGGSYDVKLAGVMPDCAASTDSVTITAASPDGGAGQTGKVLISSFYKPWEGPFFASHSDVVVTGESGDLDITIAKQGDDLIGYVDEVFLCELPDGKDYGNAAACAHIFERESCAAQWEWRSVDDYLTPFLSLTCAECGERVEVEVPVVRRESATTESDSASFAVVGGVCESSDSAEIPYHAITSAASEHGKVIADASSAKRGTAVAVKAEPEAGYALKSLHYLPKGWSVYDITQKRAFTMPSVDVSLRAVFKPALYAFGVADQTYTGKPLTPKPRVVYGDEELVEGKDYSLSYKGNVNPGMAQVTVIGEGDYEGTVSTAFKIKTADISSVSLSGLGKRTYTGKAIKPRLTVKRGKDTLEPGKDYSVSYKSNIKVGTATVTVTGKGNYSGSKSATFKITKASNPFTVKVHAASVSLSKVRKANQVIAAKRVFTVSKAKGAVSYKRLLGNGKIAVSSAGKVTVKKGLKKGTHKVQVKITAKGDANHKSGSKTVTVKISVR